LKVVILAGGRGTRAYPYTELLPKPMVPVHGKPILARVMEVYAAQGFHDFVVSVGYRKEIIEDYFGTGRNDWRVEIVDTGVACDTGGRIHGCRHVLTEPFFATYGDGLCDVDLHALKSFHESHGGLVSVTAVPLVSQYGTIEFNPAGKVMNFREKPRLRDHWINAGFFMMRPEVFDVWRGDSLERDVLPHLRELGELYAYRHDGFFKSMDTQKDQQELEDICADGVLPWLPREQLAAQ
jgi:glucose-1-phosphate cytidylyltransferase